MAAETFSSLSGQGTVAISNGWTGITTIYCRVLTLGGKISITSGTDPQQLKHAGWFGIAAGGSPHNYVAWWKYMDFEYEYTNFPGLQYGDLIIYDFEPGCDGEIEINY